MEKWLKKIPAKKSQVNDNANGPRAYANVRKMAELILLFFF